MGSPRVLVLLVLVGLPVLAEDIPSPTPGADCSDLTANIPLQQLNYETSWYGNSFSGGPKSDPGAVHVQSQFYDIHVTANGTVYTNSRYDEGVMPMGIYRNGAIPFRVPASFTGTQGGDSVTTNDTLLFETQQLVSSAAYGGDSPPVGENPYPDRTPSLLGTVYYGVSFFHLDGNPVDIVSPNAQRHSQALNFLPLAVGGVPVGKAEEDPLQGMTADKNALYVCDQSAKPSNIRVFDLHSFPAVAQSNHFQVPGCGRLALHPRSGDLWVLVGAGTGAAKLSVFSPDGVARTTGVNLSALEPSNFAFSPDGKRLYVTDNGPDQNVKIWDVSGPTPTPLPAFGSARGVFGQVGGLVPGQLGTGRFNSPTGVGVDAAGNIYVAQSTGLTYGTNAVLESDDLATGQQRWQLEGLEFVTRGSIDPTSHADLYTQDSHYQHVLAPAGQDWLASAYTFDRFSFPEDARHYNTGAVWFRQVKGQRLLYVEMQDGNHALNVYRFDDTHGEVAIPAALIAREPILVQLDKPSGHDGLSSVWPPFQPDAGQFVWNDVDHDGSFGANEFEQRTTHGVATVSPLTPTNGGWGINVDDNGDVWGSGKAIVHYVLDLDGGYPAFHLDDQHLHTDPLPAPYGGDQLVNRVAYQPSADTLWLFGFTATAPDHNTGHGVFNVGGTTVSRYPHWSKGNRQQDLSFTVENTGPGDPSSAGRGFLPDGSVWWVPRSFAVAGDYVFVAYAYPRNGFIKVYSAKDGALVGDIYPTKELHCWTGTQDFENSIDVTPIHDGKYDIVVEDDFQIRGVVYRWTPPGSPASVSSASALSTPGTAAHAGCNTTDDLELGTLGLLLTVIVVLRQRRSS